MCFTSFNLNGYDTFGYSEHNEVIIRLLSVSVFCSIRSLEKSCQSKPPWHTFVQKDSTCGTNDPVRSLYDSVILLLVSVDPQITARNNPFKFKGRWYHFMTDRNVMFFIAFLSNSFYYIKIIPNNYTLNIILFIRSIDFFLFKLSPNSTSHMFLLVRYACKSSFSKNAVKNAW